MAEFKSKFPEPIEGEDINLPPNQRKKFREAKQKAEREALEKLKVDAKPEKKEEAPSPPSFSALPPKPKAEPRPFIDPITLHGIELLPNAQEYIRKQLFKGMDIEVMVREMFGEGFDMRSPQFEAVKDFISLNFNSYTKSQEEKPAYTLTEEQKITVSKAYIEDEMGIGDICKHLFPEKAGAMGYFSPEWGAVKKHLEDTFGYVSKQRKKAPEWTMEGIAKRINECIETANLDPIKLSSFQKQCCAALISSLKSARYKETYKTFETNVERNVFESEFIRATWDKPDLTVDEINMYITVADSYVGILNTKETLNTLNAKMNEKENDTELTIKLTEAINAKNKEKNDTEKRIETLLKSLNGSRVERIEKRGANKANLVGFFEAFKQADERERLMKIAKMQREAVEKEVDRMENAEEFIARVVGISRWTAI